MLTFRALYSFTVSLHFHRSRHLQNRHNRFELIHLKLLQSLNLRPASTLTSTRAGQVQSVLRWENGPCGSGSSQFSVPLASCTLPEARPPGALQLSGRRRCHFATFQTLCRVLRPSACSRSCRWTGGSRVAHSTWQQLY